MKYVIQWKSKVNGRAGRGTKLFEKEEAERLVNELNREYPQIEHEISPAASASPQPAETADAGAARHTASSPAPVLSMV